MIKKQLLLSIVLLGLASFVTTNAQSQQIVITSPDEAIYHDARESVPIQRLIKGHVNDFSKEQMRTLKVKVRIRTDRWYNQGITRVRSDGTWQLMGYFGGTVHLIEAVVMQGGNTLTSTTQEVTRIQGKLPTRPTSNAVNAVGGQKISISSPPSDISRQWGEPMPVQREIKGQVEGFSKEQVKTLRVEVSILTDKWYPQGITRVRGDGSWRVNAWFGGAVHVIKAVVKQGGRVITSATKEVTLIQ